MDLDDLDELIQAPSQVPSRTSRFAPRSSKLKPDTEPKPKPPLPKLPQPASAPKLEPHSAPIPKKDGEETKPNINAAAVPKAEEPSASTNVEIESEADEFMDIDRPEVAVGEEEDEMVREIDVFFNPSIDSDTKLYVMQYPLRPCWRPYELDERCEQVRVKPESGEVEIDLSVNDTTNWDSDFANRVKMTKQTLVSKWNLPAADSLVVGVLKGNELYLNPIHSVVQLRPSIDHLNSGGSKKKSNIVQDVDVKLEDPHEMKPSGPSKKQSKRAQPSDEQMLDVNECWIPLKYHGSKSDFSSRCLQKMVAKESAAIDFTMSPYDYLSSLCPGSSDNIGKHRALPRRFYLSLPLEERFKRLLMEGPPVRRFAALKHFACNDSIEAVLAAVEKYGQLVQGVWAPKTSLLFSSSDPKDNIKAAARNYVLLLFTKQPVIESKLLCDVPPRLVEDVRRFVNIFADEVTSSKKWKFKERRDESFMNEHPQIVKRQSEAWESIETRLNELFQQSAKVRPGMKNATKKPGVADAAVKSLKSEKGSQKVSSGVLTKRTITIETREALLKALPKVFQNHKVCSFQLVCQGLRDLAIAQSTLPKADPRIAVAAASAADSPPEELQEVISQVAMNIHGFYVLKSSPDNPEYDPLRKIVIDLLLARGPNGKLKKSDVAEAARLTLKREISSNEYNKVMNDFCETIKGSQWVLKSGDGKPS